MPRVSVVLPAYNGERFIAAAIESVLQQTYGDWELLIVNDGSTDRTLTVIAPYLKHHADRMRLIDQPNQGVAAARNQGLAQATGELLAFLDQDDVLLPDKLALQVQCFDRHPELSIVHSGWRLVDAAGRTLADIEPWQDAPRLDAIDWIRRMPVLFSAMLFRRSALLQINGLDRQYKQACDVDLVQRLVLAGAESIWLRQVTTLYRQHDRNDSLNTLVQAEECWAVRERFFARSDLPPELRKAERDSRYYTLVWIAWRLYITGHRDRMVQHLQKALGYSPLLKTETILHWISSFKQYSSDYGYPSDTAALTESPEWQNLMRYVLMS